MPIKRWTEVLGEGGKKSSVGNWRSGISTPPQHMREKIFELGGPEPEAWDEVYTPPVAAVQLPPSDEPEPDAATPELSAEVSLGVLLEVRKALREFAAGGAADLPIEQRVRMIDQMAAAADKLGKATGVKLTARMILSSPLWAELWDEIAEVMKPWPAAMRAVADVLDRKKV